MLEFWRINKGHLLIYLHFHDKKQFFIYVNLKFM